jgi:hypothetical protein
MTALEQSVAPRVRPSLLPLRLLLVAGISWICVVTTALCLVIAPLLLGRGIVWLFLVPSPYWHDPLNMVLGIVFSQVLIKWVEVVVELLVLLKIHIALFDQRVWKLCKSINHRAIDTIITLRIFVLW